MSKKLVVYSGMNLFDLALQGYGSRASVYKLIQDNNLPGLNTMLVPGQVLQVTQPADRPDVVRQLERSGTLVNTGDGFGTLALRGISVWAIAKDFTPTPS